VAAVVLLLCGGGGTVGLIWVVKEGDRMERLREGAAERELLAQGKVVFDQRGNLVRTDPLDPTPGLREAGSRMKVHQVKLEAGKTYTISLNSRDFDAYLRLESPKGKFMAEDDDSGGDLNARIVYRITEAGDYRIVATALDAGLGGYRLIVQESD
jgi:hypothetical protein